MKALRRGIAGALVVAGLTSATPALATTYYYCYLENPYADEGYAYTPILQTSLDRIDESATGYAFSQFMDGRVPSTSIHYACDSSSKIDYIRKSHAAHIEKYGGIRAEWPDPPVPSEPVEDPVTDALVIEKAESLTVPPEQLAAMALAEERRRAAMRAKVMAEIAQRDAVLDAELQESRRRMKRLGNMK